MVRKKQLVGGNHNAALGRVSQCALLSKSYRNIPSNVSFCSSLGSIIASTRKVGVLISEKKFFNRGKVEYIDTHRLNDTT